MPEDQTCRGDRKFVELHLANEADKTAELQAELTTYAKRYNGGVDHVCLNVFLHGGEIDVDVPMTSSEAVKLVGTLIEAVRDVMGARNPPN